jgi:CheY-like chemotaxis protein
MRTLVLYVEDEPDDVLFMRMAFERAGLRDSFRAVGDGGDAIEYLAGKDAYANREQNPLPALILLDLNLPVVSGFEVLKWVRARDEFRALAVVVFSSSAREEDRSTAWELGANEYLEKPHSAAGFVQVVEGLKQRWLGR